MNYQIKNTVKELQEIVDEVAAYFPKLSEFECAQIAVQHQANRIQVAANVISSTDAYPSALEMIAIKLQEMNGGGPIITKI